MGKGAGNICFKATKGPADDTEVRGLTKSATQTESQEAAAPVVSDALAAAAPPVPEAAAAAAAAPVIVPEPKPQAVTAAKAAPEPVPSAPAPATVPAVNPAFPKRKTKIFVIFYSLYGHIYTLAQQIKKGIDSVEGCEAVLYQVAETLTPHVLEKMRAPPKPDVPLITASLLEEADGFAFGYGTRFGAMPAQMKAFFDSTGQLWQRGALTGKPATFFTSTTTPAGGADVTIFTGLTQIVPHGMIFVPVGYSYGPAMFDLSSVDVGSPYGAATITTTSGTRQPSPKELGLSEHQGALFAKVARKLHS